MPQTAEHQAFTETTRVNYPPAWDTTTGPTVTRSFEGFVLPHYSVPWAVPVEQPQGGGADVSLVLDHIRESYQNVGTAIDDFPAVPITASMRFPAPIIEAHARNQGGPLILYLIVGMILGAILCGVGALLHLELTSRRGVLRRVRGRRREVRTSHTDPAA